MHVFYSRAELLQLYERCILLDIEFSDNQSVDQILWKNAFYQVIEKFRQLLKDPNVENPEQIRNRLLELLDEVKYHLFVLRIKALASCSFSGFLPHNYYVVNENMDKKLYVLFMGLGLLCSSCFLGTIIYWQLDLVLNLEAC